MSLLASVRAKDARGWHILVALYSPLLYNWCQQAKLSTDESSDVLQEVFSAVWTGIDSFRRDRSGDTFRGWLRGITRNKLADHFRTKTIEPRAAGGVQELELLNLAEPRMDSTIEPSETRLTFLRALEMVRSEFEPLTWQAFLSTVVEGRPAPEAALDLDLTPAAVRQAKCRVLRRLRLEFGEVID